MAKLVDCRIATNSYTMKTFYGPTLPAHRLLDTNWLQLARPTHLDAIFVQLHPHNSYT